MTDADRAALRRQLIEGEGLRLRVYTDTVGKATIGVGRNLVDKGLSTDEAMSLLDHDIDEVDADLWSFGWYPTASPPRRAAMCELRFILGPHGFRGFVKMLDAAAQDDWQGVGTEVALSHLSTQLQPSRFARIVRQLRTGEWA